MDNLMEIGTKELIAEAIRLDSEQKKGRSLLNRYKAELERRGMKVMEDQNTHYVRFFGEIGRAHV